MSKAALPSVVATAVVLGLHPLLATRGVGTSSAEAIRVSMDIKPDDASATVNPRSGGMMPVAILTTEEFDATTVDPATVRLGATGTEAKPFRSVLEDVDDDGDTDMKFLFRVRQTGLECGDTAVSLTGQTADGQEIEGSEAVKTEGCA